MTDQEAIPGFVNERDCPDLKRMIQETLDNPAATITGADRRFLGRMLKLDRLFTKAEEKEIHILWHPKKKEKPKFAIDPEVDKDIPF